MSDDHKYFTVVFQGNLAHFKGNPLTTVTPFGTPIACGYGDAFARVDVLEDRIQEMADECCVPVRDRHS